MRVGRLTFNFPFQSRDGRHPSAQRRPARYHYYLVYIAVILCFFAVWTSYDTYYYDRSVSLSHKIPTLAANTTFCALPNSNSTSADAWEDIEGDHYPQKGHRPQIGCANATFVILARNKELKGLLASLKQIEDRFNHAYHYPYVFLNDQPFTETFKTATSKIVSSKVQYGLIPQEHWFQPSSIDEEKATESRNSMVDQGVHYAASVSYRNMCRFNSGFFFRHELLQQYRYYWRIEPDVSFFCDIDEDPFMFMKENDKVYGFTLALYEAERSIPTLWDVTKEFIKEHPQYLVEDNAMGFLSDNYGKSYNLCHYWSNFEIADMDFWRSEAYMKYFEYLDSKGGFYYERWGDAPVHSLAVSLFARKDQIHFFEEIGYRHGLFQHCPQGFLHTKGKCSCAGTKNFDYDGFSCLNRFDRLFTDKWWSW